MDENALLAFDKVLQQIPGLPPHQIQATLWVCRQVEKLPEDAFRWVSELAMLDHVQAALSICREMEKLPQGTPRWVCQVARLTRENLAVGGLLEDLLRMVHHKLEKEGSSKVKRHTLKKLVRTLVFHHRNCYRFACEGELAQFLPGIDEPAALAYYNGSIVGAVHDKQGRRIDIWKYGVRHLYKDVAHGHTVDPEFFQMNRAKRLPWIRHVLLNSTEIYEERMGRFGKPNLAYVGQTIIGADKPKYPQYFLVFVESNKSQKLGFISAFHVEEHDKFLKFLAGCTPPEVKCAE